MLSVLTNAWALLFGIFLLQIGNGLQGTLLGVRGGLEGFSATTMGYVMSGYFVGFLGGARITPWLLHRVGHVRVFAALASLISAAFILYAALVDPLAWFIMRLMVGFCFSGVYVVAESWLNDTATNETRGQTLSAYLMAQMIGIVLAQALLNVSDPGGYDLFIIMSVVVSVSFAPILLSVSPTPVYQLTTRMTLRELFISSPLGCVGMFLLGTIFACLFGMSSVYAAAIGLTTTEISLFIGTIYVGGTVLQYPIGWLSDHSDRRVLITGTMLLGTAAAILGMVASDSFALLLVAAFLIGGVANPLYSLLIAHTNDFLEHEKMASAAGGMIMLNGIGAMGAPVLVGYLMDDYGPNALMAFIGAMMALIAAYGLYRMTARPTVAYEDATPLAPVGPAATGVAMEIAQDYVIDQTSDAQEMT